MTDNRYQMKDRIEKQKAEGIEHSVKKEGREVKPKIKNQKLKIKI